MNYMGITIKDIPWTDQTEFMWPAGDVKLHRFVGQVADIDKAMAYVPEGRRRVCVQAGGAAGIWPLRLSTLFDTVYTFEPMPIMFRCLVANIAQADNIVAMNAALGHQHQMVRMQHPEGREDNFGAQHIMPDGGHIPMLKVDDLQLPALDFLMLDTEGAELFAILGAMNAIVAYRPVIMYEDKGHGALFGYEQGFIDKVLEGLGYRVAERINRDTIMVPK